MADRYAVIGNPVAHSKSPWIHAEFARQTGDAVEYGAIEAPLGGFAAAVGAFRAAGGRGLNVTLPFKQEAFRYCRDATARARAAAAVNTLSFAGEAVSGDNTDGAGLVTDLESNLGFAIAGRRVLLLGAGGAARGVVGPLLERAPAALAIANRTVARGEALAAAFRGVRATGFEGLAGESFDLVVNATSAGLEDRAPPLPPGIFAAGALAYDMVYGRETPFLRLARAAGAAARDGLGMLVEQAAESFLVWRGVRPRTAPVLEALRRG
ncbi:MAG TPA: shikimate dehydrogenase [Burkholderiales bacterium]|nr:shikimate dehydrogenase [Burkholderiales bacterium]